MDADARNSGLYNRTRHMLQSRVVDMIGRLHADIFFQDRWGYMLKEVGVRIKLVRSNDAFCVMASEDCKVKITKAIMLVRIVKLSPIRRVVCKTFTIPNGFKDVSREKLFSGQLPTRIVVGLVSNEAFNGSRTQNPFNFRNFGVTEIGLYLDGQQQGCCVTRCRCARIPHLSG